MNKRFLPFVTQSVLTAFFLYAGIVHAKEAQRPNNDAGAARDLIIAVTTDVMNIVKNDPAIAKNISRLSQIVNQKILPHTDMQRATQLAMGRHWRAATPQQQEQLAAQFQDLLFYTSAGALSKVSTTQLKNQPQIDYRPLRIQPSDTDIVVETIVMNENKPVNIDYRLEKTPKGWKVYDVNVAGIWLIQTYREQFDEQITQKGIEGLLKFLSERNQQLKVGAHA